MSLATTTMRTHKFYLRHYQKVTMHGVVSLNRRSVAALHTFLKPTAEHISDLKYLLPGGVLTSESDPGSLDKYNQDWMNKYKGSSDVVLLPKSTEEVSRVVSYCNKHNLPIVPQGGNTGLVGGGVPLGKELVLSTAKLNKIKSLDQESGIFSAESGVVLQDANTYLEPHKFMMPLDLGSKGSCTIGGNVSTNAGGIRYLRYGSLHGSVVGLEVVLANGEVLDLMSPVRKDNTGYDLKQLFIGAEGTLGVVTAVSIQVATLPNAMNGVLIGVRTFDDVRKVLAMARQEYCAEILSAAEYWDRSAMELLLDVIQEGVRDPLGSKAPYYLLIETHGSNDSHDKEKLFGMLEALQATGLALDGALAQDNQQLEAFWRLREWLPVAVKDKGGIALKYDVSVPAKLMDSITNQTREHLKNSGIEARYGTEVVQWGHLGDGNLHINVRCDSYHQDVVDAMEPFIYEVVAKCNGSISAEHGIGQMKVGALKYTKSATAIEMMRQVKLMMDPKGILNPYKVLPTS